VAARAGSLRAAAALGRGREGLRQEEAPSARLEQWGSGGNLALAVALKLKQLGEPLPGAIFAGTPATDLEHVTDTWYTLARLDPLGTREGMLAAAFELYGGDMDPANPLLSPVNGDLEGFPPTLLVSGTRDLLPSDTVRMHRALRAAGVEADLHVYDAQTHGDCLQNLVRDVPEWADAQRELFEFFDAHLE
jgi:acetyl esterase/lipase